MRLHSSAAKHPPPTSVSGPSPVFIPWLSLCVRNPSSGLLPHPSSYFPPAASQQIVSSQSDQRLSMGVRDPARRERRQMSTLALAAHGGDGAGRFQPKSMPSRLIHPAKDTATKSAVVNNSWPSPRRAATGQHRRYACCVGRCLQMADAVSAARAPGHSRMASS
jgi:hypothetical protein